MRADLLAVPWKEVVARPGRKQVFYVNGNRIMSVDLNTESGLNPSKPRTLFERTFSTSSADAGQWGHTLS